MKDHNLKTRLRASTIFASAILAVASIQFASAQEAEEPVQVAENTADEEAVQDRVLVTGSRILRRDEIAESPILTVGQADFTQSGFTTVDQFLNTLPQVTPGISSQSNNPSSNGRAVIDLRGLGSGRNLVLLDGRRGMPSFAGGTVDINTIPAALIERVEIITGGAASTYGADAVAGVANFILRKDFEGAEFDTQYRATTEEGDGVEWGGSVTLGSNFADDRGNAVISFSYFEREVLGKGARDFSAQASGATGSFPGGSFVPGANAPSQAAVDAIFGGNLCNANGGAGGFGFNPDGSVFCTGVAGDPSRNVVGYEGPESDIATRFFPDRFSYNFEPDNNLVLPLERWNMFAAADYELNENARFYGQVIFTNYNAEQELAPTPVAGTTGFTVPVTNPFLSQELRNLLASRANPTAPFAYSGRFKALGGRVGNNTHDVWQAQVGMDGKIPQTETWTYDVYASFGRSTLNEIQGGNVRRPQVQTLLDAADGGASICSGGLNIFGPQEISQECQDYISLEAKNLTVIEQNVVEATVQGEVFQLPAGPVQVAFGTQYRSMDFDFKPDSGLQPGLVAGFNNQLPVSGYLDWFDVYGEALVPIVKDLPFAKDISVTLGYRLTDNNLSGESDTYKINADWMVNDWLRFRGGYQAAIRSPSITELFAPVLNNFPNINNADPCNTTGAITSNAEYGRAGANGAQVQALCAAQSVVAGGATYVQPAAQATGLNGGNVNLTPEESTSYTVGFVASSPFKGNSFTESLSLSVDYWSIELTDVIAAVGATTIIQRCYNRDGANPTYDINNTWCQLFDRDPNNGGVINLEQFSQNQANVSVSGIDLTARWGFDTSDVGFNVGRFDWLLLTTWTESSTSQTTPNDPEYDFVGSIGSGTGSATPEWKVNLDTRWTYADAAVTLGVRYIDDMINTNVVTGGSPVSNTGTPATYYVDLRGTYDILENVQLRGGINNILDQEPRLYTPSNQANTDPSTFDVLGRRFFIGVNVKF